MTKHRVNRVEIELEASDVALARSLRIPAARVEAVLERVFSEVSPLDRVDRLERVEVHLGSLTTENLESNFATELETALRAALTNVLRRPTRVDSRPACIELIETFALTGSLPWWESARDAAVVRRHFEHAAEVSRAALVASLAELAADQGALERLTTACDMAPAAILARLATGEEPREEQGVALPGAATQLRAERWQARKDLSTSEAERSGADVRQERAVGQLALESSTELADSGSGPRGSGEDVKTSSATPPPHTAGAPSERRAHAGSTDNERARSAHGPPIDGASDAPADPVPQPATTSRLRSQPVAAPPAARSALRRAALARLDEIYVDDAGLVILWPFLERFFQRVGLLAVDRRFTSDEAARQALVLLEALATGDSDPPEFLLPLAKLLCGRAIDSDLRPVLPLPPESLAEGDNLLAAVIDRAEVLGDLSVAGFRKEFLRRPAALSTRAGAWLLQVEARPADVLLAKFPWSWEWVRLPWMTDPLRVEW